LPLVNVMPLDELLAGTRFANQVFATLFAAFAAIALLLAAIGLHAITAFSVTARTREIGVRVALGAQPSAIVWLFVRRTLPPLAIGLVLGSIGAFGIGAVVRSMLIGTSPHDPLTLAVITIVLTAVVLLAAFRPAHRATRLDPVASLRHE
jgi:putative ABC transport system permease protein